jgi:hypothetical protein
MSALRSRERQSHQEIVVCIWGPASETHMPLAGSYDASVASGRLSYQAAIM